MITIKAFRALRPKEKWVKEVAALPYDVMTDEEAAKMVTGHPYSFLNIDKPEIHVSTAEDAAYNYARRQLSQMIEEGIFVQETRCLYLYELISPYGSQYGLACLVSAEDYKKGRIKKHEKTRVDKEEDRIKHIAYCRAHTGPVFLIEDEIEAFGSYLQEYANGHKPLYDFTDDEGVTQRLYAIKEQAQIEYLSSLFTPVSALYIADGHHRAAAASAIAERMGSRLPEAGDFLAVIFPKEQLHVLAYNRMIKDESGYNKTELLQRLSQNFEIKPQREQKVYMPASEHEIGMYYKNQWFSLKLRPDCLKGKSLVDQLDVTILQNEVLSPVFKITEPKTDSRIDFIPGLAEINAAEECRKREMDIIFTLYPTSVDSLIAIADAGGIMPPKSTWFEPKLRSGLLIHPF